MKRAIIINLLILILLNLQPKEIKVEAKEGLQTAEITAEQISSRSLEEPRQEMSVKTDKELSKATEISQEGIDLIKQFEGLRLQAYRLEGEKYWTIRIWNT